MSLAYSYVRGFVDRHRFLNLQALDTGRAGHLQVAELICHSPPFIQHVMTSRRGLASGPLLICVIAFYSVVKLLLVTLTMFFGTYRNRLAALWCPGCDLSLMLG
jgi:hypothetical protein